MTGALYVRNEAQKVLFEKELTGQISDGAWENASPHDHWQVWSDCEVRLGTGTPMVVGRTFYARKDNYGFTRSDLLEIIGDRMVEMVRALGGCWESYDMDDLRRDLRDLKHIVRTQVPEQADEPVSALKRENVSAERARVEAIHAAEAADAEVLRLQEALRAAAVESYLAWVEVQTATEIQVRAGNALRDASF